MNKHKYNMKRGLFNHYTRLSHILMLAGIFCFGLMLSSCGDEEDDTIPNGTENDGTDNGSSESSIYTEDMFVGVWIKIQSVNSWDSGNPTVYNDPKNEWSIMFESDKIHGSYRHFWSGNPSILDFKWWLSSGNKIRIVELDTGSDYEVEATFTDNNTWLILRYDYGTYWEEDTYVKKGYNPYY